MRYFKSEKVRFVVITALLALVGFLIYRGASGKNNQLGERQTATVKVEKGTIRDTVSASGRIETANYLAVTTSVNGIVKKVFVKEGDAVKKNTPVMEVTLSSEGEESLASAWASYISAKSSLESAKNSLLSLESTLISAEEDFEDEKEQNSYQSHDERVSYKLAENAVKVAQFNYDSQKDVIVQRQVALNKAWLTYQAQSPKVLAPADGVVANIVAVEGMDITNSLSERTSSTVASIRQGGTPIASLNVNEVDINKVRVGEKVELTLNSIDGKVFTGTVVGIDKIGATSSGVANYPVIVKFDEDSNLVLPNMGVDAEIIVQEKSGVIYVPSSAIVSVRGQKMVRVQENDQKVKPVAVETGVETAENVEIISGIEEGATVVVDSLPTSGFTSTTSDQNDRPRGIFMTPGVGGGVRR